MLLAKTYQTRVRSVYLPWMHSSVANGSDSLTTCGQALATLSPQEHSDKDLKWNNMSMKWSMKCRCVRFTDSVLLFDSNLSEMINWVIIIAISSAYADAVSSQTGYLFLKPPSSIWKEVMCIILQEIETNFVEFL